MLSSERVKEVFMKCLFGNDVDGTKIKYVMVEGANIDTAFHPERLQLHKAEVEAMLDELPEDFRDSVGGGWSLLDALKDRCGNQWADSEECAEQLFQLGIGIGKVRCLGPLNLHSAVPSGIPYYVINDV